MTFGRRVCKAFQDRTFQSPGPSAPSEVWLALVTTAPGKDGAGAVEVVGGSYVRQQLQPADFNVATFAAQPARLLTAAEIPYPEATADWADGSPDQIVGAVLVEHETDAIAESNYGGYAALVDALDGTPTPQTVENGDTLTIPAGALAWDLSLAGDDYGVRHSADLLNWYVGKTPATTPAGIVYPALFVGDCGIDGQSGVEVAAASYSRPTLSPAHFSAATLADPSSMSSAALIQWAKALESWGTPTHIGFMNHATDTDEDAFVMRYAIPVPKAIGVGQRPRIAIGSLTSTVA